MKEQTGSEGESSRKEVEESELTSELEQDGEEETLENKAGKSMGQLEDQGGALPDLGLDLAVLDSPELRNPDILERIFSFLGDPASVKAASLVSK